MNEEFATAIKIIGRWKKLKLFWRLACHWISFFSIYDRLIFFTHQWDLFFIKIMKNSQMFEGTRKNIPIRMFSMCDKESKIRDLTHDRIGRENRSNAFADETLRATSSSGHVFSDSIFRTLSIPSICIWMLESISLYSVVIVYRKKGEVNILLACNLEREV